MVRTTVTLLMSLSLLSVGQAHAEEFCALLASVSNEVPNKFRTLRAGPDGSGDYQSSVVFPGAKNCYVTNELDFFSCNWKLASDEDAGAQGRTLAEGVIACFPGGRTIPARTSGSGTSYRYIADGVNFTVRASTSRHHISLRINAE